MDHLPQRLKLVAAETRWLDPDIVLLQEVPNSRPNGDSAAYLAQQTGLNHIYLHANGNRRLLGLVCHPSNEWHSGSKQSAD